MLIIELTILSTLPFTTLVTLWLATELIIESTMLIGVIHASTLELTVAVRWQLPRLVLSSA